MNYIKYGFKKNKKEIEKYIDLGCYIDNFRYLFNEKYKKYVDMVF